MKRTPAGCIPLLFPRMLIRENSTSDKNYVESKQTCVVGGRIM